MVQSIIVGLLVAAAFLAADSRPEITCIGPVAPDILGLVIDCDGFVPMRQEPYKPEPGDELKTVKQTAGGEVTEMQLVRSGRAVGWISGKDNDWFCPFEQNTCPPLDTAAADRPETYVLTSADDPAYAYDIRPLKVSRKTKPLNWTGPDRGPSPLRHYIYLHLPAKLTNGNSYAVGFKGLNTAADKHTFRFRDTETVSEAIHVNQAGFRPDDPAKRACLSIWLGNGGGYTYDGELTFRIIDDTTGREVLKGAVQPSFRKDQQEYSAYGVNANLTDVYYIDFNGLDTPGVYRVSVTGIGCSPAFPVSTDARDRAFVTSLRGFYHQRSGIALGPPYTAFIHPRNYHPDDGVQIYDTTFDQTLNPKGQDGIFEGLTANRTKTVLPGLWGGYHDAGDWDRRIMHLHATFRQLELAELFPERVKAIRSTIPESSNDLPDVIDEALFNLDFYRRMQVPAGGVRGGIEATAHPRAGEVSWHESLTLMAYAPDVWSTYVYARTAARAALVLKALDAELAATYQQSALRAMNWAEARYPQWSKNKGSRKFHDSGRDFRNSAALELYRVTGEEKWHRVFLADTRISAMQDGIFKWGKDGFDQGDAAFSYTLLPDGKGQADLKAQARQAIITTADAAVVYSDGNAFNAAHFNKYMPRINGFFAAPMFPELARAHYLTRDAKYLRALCLAVNFGQGANPMNQTLTTGLGGNPPRHPLHLDSRRTGQPAPEGLTLYGMCDMPWAQANGGGGTLWGYKWGFDKQCTPSGYEWPVTENYFDVCMYPPQCEFTIQGPMEFACYNWGYLALRP